MKQFFLFIFIILASINAYSQPITEVRGVILDKEERAPIGGVIVYLFVKGMPSTYTNSDGSFLFNVLNLGIDINTTYRISFYKSGYENISEVVELPLKKPIELKKSSAGFIQLQEFGTNRFLDGIEVRHQESKPDTTDRFGFYAIDIPPGVSPDKDYRLAIKGGCCFYDTIVTFKTIELRDKIVSIFIKPKKLGYFELVDAFDDELDRFWKGLVEENAYEQDVHLDKCSNFITNIQDLKPLSKQEQEDYRNRMPIMTSTIEELRLINLYAKEIKDIEKKHREAVRKFSEAYKLYTSNPTSFSLIPKKMEELMSLGFISLKLSVDRWKLVPQGIGLVNKEVAELLKLIEHAEDVKNNKIPKNYPQREVLIQELESLILRNSTNLESIIESMK